MIWRSNNNLTNWLNNFMLKKDDFAYFVWNLCWLAIILKFGYTLSDQYNIKSQSSNELESSKNFNVR
jgi:hypothetical protein